MIVARVLLFPFAVLYDIITSIRNKLYDLGLKPSSSFDLPVICVGNLRVGGTGKTPMVEYLLRRFEDFGKPAMLSRGYGRSTKGFRLAGAADDASTLGDEPYQIFRKFHDAVTIAVGEERALAIPQIVDEYPDTAMIVLDDAFQHRQVKPTLSILLTSFAQPFTNDFLLPAGRLRERRSGADRADVIVVTKCPEHLEEEDQIAMEHAIRRYADKPVFFSTIHYGDPVSFCGPANFAGSVVLVTGLADPSSLVNYVRHQYDLVGHREFPDHHVYTVHDVEAIAKLATRETVILTTEKDMVKLSAPALKGWIDRMPIFYLPIEMQFLRNGPDFDALVTSVLKREPDIP